MQSLANALVAGSLYALVGMSFSIIYGPNQFFHFTHGAVFAWAAYVAYVVHVILSLPLPFAIALTVVVASLLGFGLGKSVYGPLSRRGARGVVLLLASLGLYLVLQNLLSVFFGDDARSLRTGSVSAGVNVLGARVTPIQIWAIGAGVLSLLAVWLVLSFSRAGRMFKAVTCDAELASSLGVDANRVILAAFAIGSGLAGLAGFLVAMDLDITPTMGLRYLMMGVVASVVGGIRSVPGAFFGGMLLGFAQHFGVWVVGTAWQDAIAFVILILFLAFRPQGFFGEPLRGAKV